MVPIEQPASEVDNATTVTPSEIEETDTIEPNYTTIGTDTSVQPGKTEDYR